MSGQWQPFRDADRVVDGVGQDAFQNLLEMTYQKVNRRFSIGGGPRSHTHQCAGCEKELTCVCDRRAPGSKKRYCEACWAVKSGVTLVEDAT